MAPVLHQPGASRRSRGRRMRMQEQYYDAWEHRLPVVESARPYRKLGLPLILAPFVLMFCGGCVSVAPVVSGVVALLLGVVWFGEVILEESQTSPYWVVYWRTAPWLVGEDQLDAVARRRSDDTSTYVERYPDVYPGRIRSVIPSTSQRPTYVGEHLAVEVVDMMRSEFLEANLGDLKYVNGQLVPVLFEDRFGASSDWVRGQYTEEQALDAMAGVDSPVLEGIEQAIALYQKTSIPRTIAHTGTGLYSVKAAPTHNDDTQSGAPAGQVITLAVGGLGVLDAFQGGYVVNATETETRAIVSHTDDTITLEGDLTNWTDTDDLDIYDAWSTVQGACDQLFTDQGAGAYTMQQEIRLFDGTYNEDVDIEDMASTDRYRMLITAAAGNTSVIVSNDGLAMHTFDFGYNDRPEVTGITVRSNVVARYGVYSTSTSSGIWIHDLVITDSTGADNGSGYRTYGGSATDCELVGLNDGIVGRYSAVVVRQCSFRCANISLSELASVSVIHGCVFDGGTYAIRIDAGEPAENYSPRIANCTFYSCTHVLCNAAASAANQAIRCTFYNNIVHTATDVFSGDEVFQVDADYNTYYNCTNIADVDGSTYNLAGWQALTDAYGLSPDAHSVTTDPGLASPGLDDFSLTAASLSRHSGVGSYALCPAGINGVDFDKWHPDKGAWSSGDGPNRVWGG